MKLSFWKRIALIAFGVFLAVGTLEVSMRIVGSIWIAGQSDRNVGSLSEGGAFTILCIGESTTAFGGESSYPRLLEEELNRRAGERRYVVINGGRPRITTEELREGLPAQLEQYEPDLVVAMMGINDRRYLRAKGERPVVSWFHDLRVVKLAKLLAEHLSLRWSEPESSARERLAEAQSIPAAEQKRRYEAMLEKLEASPKDVDLLARAAVAARLMGRDYWSEHPGVEASFLTRVQADPSSTGAWADLVAIRSLTGRHDQVVNDVHAAIEHVELPKSTWSRYLDSVAALRRVRVREKRLSQAEDLIRRALTVLPEDMAEARADLVGDLSVLMRRQGRGDEADRLETQATASGRTRDNYRAIADAVRQSGADLVVMQYPLRSVDQLKSTIGDVGAVAYVDNSAVFREAVRRLGYQAVFIDRFAGDFGHLSPTGRRLLANNVADALMEVAPGREMND